MGDLGDLLKSLREESHYPTRRSAAQICGVHERNYRGYEEGKSLPSDERIDLIVSKLSIPADKADELKRLKNRERAARMGVDLNGGRPPVNVSEVAAKIQREVEYELRRVGGVEVTPKTRRVCLARIEMILKHALGET